MSGCLGIASAHIRAAGENHVGPALILPVSPRWATQHPTSEADITTTSCPPDAELRLLRNSL
jgi:hypothetical protein